MSLVSKKPKLIINENSNNTNLKAYYKNIVLLQVTQMNVNYNFIFSI